MNKRKISTITIILMILLVLLMIRFSLIEKEARDLKYTCDSFQSNLDYYQEHSVSYTQAVAGWVSCISDEDDLKIKSVIISYVILIVVFLILLSWKIDKLKKK